MSRQYKIIDTASLPEKASAYIIRYEAHDINRLKGSRPIIKIGSASKGIKNRFDNYNHQKDVTAKSAELFDFLGRSQKTNVRVMHFLSHHEHPGKIVIDIYYNRKNKSPTDIELELIKNYMQVHKELPPLNFGIK